jgi:hypothetical protein
MCFFRSLIREFLTQLAIWFVVFLRSEMSFRPISHLLSLLEVFAFSVFFRSLEVV